MARAMGLNTICAYLFWNQIEPRPGHFNWSGPANLAEFCRIAQEDGLWAILRLQLLLIRSKPASLVKSLNLGTPTL